DHQSAQGQRQPIQAQAGAVMKQRLVSVEAAGVAMRQRLTIEEAAVARKARIVEGDYSQYDIARFLLLVAGSESMAKRALRAVAKTGTFTKLKRGASDDMLFLVARKIQLQLRAENKRCSDFTAIQELAGDRWRNLYRAYQRRRRTLQQIARLYGLE